MFQHLASKNHFNNLSTQTFDVKQTTVIDRRFCPFCPPSTFVNIKSPACLPTNLYTVNNVCFSSTFGSDLISQLHRLTDHVALSYCMPLFTPVTSTTTMGSRDWLHELPVMPTNFSLCDLPTSEPSGPSLSFEVG